MRVNVSHNMRTTTVYYDILSNISADLKLENKSDSIKQTKHMTFFIYMQMNNIRQYTTYNNHIKMTGEIKKKNMKAQHENQFLMNDNFIDEKQIICISHI